MSKILKRNDLHGLLIIDKPEGLSSQQVVTRVKHSLNVPKAGHTGTLDPIATGMLPICLNHATRFTEFLLSADKAYRVTAKLGETTETGDREGAILDTVDVPVLSIDQIKTCLDSFIGEQEQTAPKYSALKYQGKPLYYWARKGIEVPLKKRMISIKAIKFLDFNGTSISFEATVSKGTYIRSLVESIGEYLKCGAHMTALRRLWVSPFESHNMNALDSTALNSAIIPIDSLLPQFNDIDLDPTQSLQLLNGRVLSINDKDGIYKLYGQNMVFYGLGEVNEQKLKAFRLLPTVDFIQALSNNT